VTRLPLGNDWPAQRETTVRLSGIARPEMVSALEWSRSLVRRAKGGPASASTNCSPGIECDRT
jgi:hypothetical protein